MALPQFFALHTTYGEISEYVRFTNEDVSNRGFLSIAGLDVVSPFTRFEVVESKSTRDDGLVNIRCCYNHKYWVKSENSNKIVAGADEPEEDQSKWSCTLFEPIYNGDKIVKFRHANLNHHVYFEVAAPSKESWLYLKKEIPSGTSYCDEFIVTDLVSMMILPKYAVLKGHDGTFLRPGKIDNGPLFIKFADDDIKNPTVMLEVCTTHDGSISLNNLDGIWKRNSNDWILVHPDNGQPIDTDMLFWPTKVNINVVALLNLGNNHFCKRVNDPTNRLSPIDPYISDLAHIKVDEPVTSRRIDNLNYFLRDSWIYNRTPVVIATEEVENNTPQPIKRVVKFYFTDIRSSCWNSSASLKLESVPTTLCTTAPFIDDNGNIIVVPVEVCIPFPYKWGETTMSETAMEKVDEVTVKPMSKITVKLIATKASYDVPFSYSQLDTLINGKKVPYSLEDGVYIGTNCYNYRFENEEENL